MGPSSYSTGAVLGPHDSALANPVPYAVNPPHVDNLVHATHNAFGNPGGSGYAART
jgi:hypothetical protein